MTYSTNDQWVPSDYVVGKRRKIAHTDWISSDCNLSKRRKIRHNGWLEVTFISETTNEDSSIEWTFIEEGEDSSIEWAFLEEGEDSSIDSASLDSLDYSRDSSIMSFDFFSTPEEISIPAAVCKNEQQQPAPIDFKEGLGSTVICGKRRSQRLRLFEVTGSFRNEKGLRRSARLSRS